MTSSVLGVGDPRNICLATGCWCDDRYAPRCGPRNEQQQAFLQVFQGSGIKKTEENLTSADYQLS